MNNYLHKGLTIIALALLLASCSETATVTQNTKPISSAQSDIDKGTIAAKSKSYKKAINFFATSKAILSAIRWSFASIIKGSVRGIFVSYSILLNAKSI